MPIVYWVDQYYPKYEMWIGTGKFVRSRDEAYQALLEIKAHHEDYGITEATDYRVGSKYFTMEEAILNGMAPKGTTMWHQNNDEHNSVMSDAA